MRTDSGGRVEKLNGWKRYRPETHVAAVAAVAGWVLSARLEIAHRYDSQTKRKNSTGKVGESKTNQRLNTCNLRLNSHGFPHEEPHTKPKISYKSRLLSFRIRRPNRLQQLQLDIEWRKTNERRLFDCAEIDVFADLSETRSLLFSLI